VANKKIQVNKLRAFHAVKRDAKSGQFIARPDMRDFRGGFQPRQVSPVTCMPKLPSSGSAVKIIKVESVSIKGVSSKSRTEGAR